MYKFYIQWTALIITAYCISELCSIKSTTLNVKQRVAILRDRIVNEIREKIYQNHPIEENSSFEENEYDHDRLLLTPLINQKKKQQKKKQKTKALTRSTSMSTVKIPAVLRTETQHHESTPFSQIRSKKPKATDKVAKEISNDLNVFTNRNPVEIFYRRLIDENQMNSDVTWAHCQDLITPFLRGLKIDLTFQKHLTSNSPVVRRFIHLMTLNTTAYTKEDIFSVLYQISNLQLRLFQWDVTAINLLFNVLMKEKKHTFRNLKWSIRTYFEDWRLDISNLTNLLQQTRLFRPPCIKISDTTGSTKSVKVSSYPKKVSPLYFCDPKENGKCKKRS